MGFCVFCICLFLGEIFMRYFLINEGTPFEIRASLSAYGVCIPLPPLASLPFPVCRHPDMLMAQIFGRIFVHREFREGQTILENLGVPFLCSEKAVGARYPNDVSLNCFSVGDMLFAKENAVSDEVLSWAKENGKTVANVKQGYAKCSTVIAGGRIASADRGIVKAAQSANIPALLLPSQPIGIEVYDTGFLGGASLMLDERTLGFFGNVETYPSYAELKAFFAEVGVKIVSLSERPLFDYGGAVTLAI